MSSELGRVKIIAKNSFAVPLPLFSEGWALGYVVKHPMGGSVYLTRVAIDDGTVVDVSDIVLRPIESDITSELMRPELPAITTPDEQTDATAQLAKVYQLMEQNRRDILEVEATIKQRQNEIAAEIRAIHAELYESQRITAIVYSEHEARIQAGAEALWQAAGQPIKGKTFGAAQIADDWQCVQFDPDKALEFARTQIPALISTHVDEAKFKQAVKDGLLKNVPADVCRWEKGHKVKTLTAVLKQAAPPLESE